MRSSNRTRRSVTLLVAAVVVLAATIVALRSNRAAPQSSGATVERDVAATREAAEDDVVALENRVTRDRVEEDEVTPVEAPRPTPVDATATGTLRLVTPAGEPMPNVAYWIGDRPHRTHPTTPPGKTPRTSPDGSLERPSLAEGQWLWFALSHGVALAVSDVAVASSEELTAPALRDVEVRIDGLDPEDSWIISIYPGRIEPDGDFEHGTRAIDPVAGHEFDMAVLRERVFRKGKNTPAQVTFTVAAEMPAAFYTQSNEAPVEPEIQELLLPRDVVATAGERWPAIEFEIVDASGSRDPTVAGVASLYLGATRGHTGQAFARGAGRIARTANEDTLCVVALDGEVFIHELDGPDPVRLVRGTGTPPDARLPVRDDGKDLRGGEVKLLQRGRLVPTDPIEWFEPISEDSGVAAWWNGDELIAHGIPLNASVDGLLIVLSERALGFEHRGHVAALPMKRLEPIDLADVVERFGPMASRRRYVQVLVEARHERLVDGTGGIPPWVMIDLSRCHVVDGYGWRVSRTSSIDHHTALGAPLEVWAPRDSEVRVRVRPAGADEIVLPWRFAK